MQSDFKILDKRKVVVPYPHGVNLSPALYQHQTTRHGHLIRARWVISRNGKDSLFGCQSDPRTFVGATPATFLVRCEDLDCSLHERSPE
jgi:hypothetical protein